jgi:hypothetical protein
MSNNALEKVKTDKHHKFLKEVEGIIKRMPVENSALLDLEMKKRKWFKWTMIIQVIGLLFIFSANFLLKLRSID